MFCNDPPPTCDEVTNAFWSACHGGQLATAEYLRERGADLKWVAYDGLIALDVANLTELTNSFSGCAEVLTSPTIGSHRCRAGIVGCLGRAAPVPSGFAYGVIEAI